MYDANNDGEASVVVLAAAVVGGGVGVGVASEEAVHLPVKERQGAWSKRAVHSEPKFEKTQEERVGGWG